MSSEDNMGLLLKLIKQVSESYHLDPNLVGAVVSVESSYSMWATRYEPGYIYLKNPSLYAKKLGLSEATERTMQKISWGLMQIMGGVARELGYSEHLTQLCLPEINLEFGCKKLAILLDKYKSIGDAVSAYNQGSPKKSGVQYLNQGYVDKVMLIYTQTITIN